MKHLLIPQFPFIIFNDRLVLLRECKLKKLCLASVLALPIFLGSTLPDAIAQAQPDMCLALVDKNLAKGPNNFFVYVRFSSKSVKISDGDVLSYDLFLDPANPEPKGGIDVNFEDGAPLRESHISDQDGVDSHGDGVVTQASGKWDTRQIPLSNFAGRTTSYWTLDFEGDSFGRYAQFVDNIKIIHSDGTSTPIYPSSAPLEDSVDTANGYSENPSLALIPRSEIEAGKKLDPEIAQVEASAGRLREIASLQAGINLALRDPQLTDQERVSLAPAQQAIQGLNAKVADSKADFDVAVQKAIAKSSSAQKVLKSMTADLIGHAHIDVQWLWQSPESLQAAHNTWTQAVKFMAEYPGFTFTQSSSGYYSEVQKTWPALFANIQHYVKTGQWEIVGGRVCEADENLISPEAHARDFLYAQGYFRKEFGKTTNVGWEPDTFGHTAQMPQILQLGGCKYYYFCRGGKDKPLFTWEGLDGSKVLAYDQAAAGSWYDIALDNNTFQQLPGYIKKTGTREMMWAYGVGNHGGGPTKEYIDQAETWMKSPLAPKVQFSTALAFFDRMSAQSVVKLPTVDSELEGVFRGCYTTNSFEKKNNDYSEADTVQAESISVVANALGGWPYPTDQFAHNWKKILFNQHHDTICGSSFHWAYQQTIPDLQAVMKTDQDISRDAMENLCVQVTPSKNNPNFLVFNSLGWKRSGWVSAYVSPDSGSAGSNGANVDGVAIAPDGSTAPLEVVSPVTGAVRFWAKDLPAFGYRVYALKKTPGGAGSVVTPNETAAEVNLNSATVDTLSGDGLTAKFDLDNGTISSLKIGDQEFAGPDGLGEMVNTAEQPQIEAWDINPIVSTVSLKPISHRLVNDGSHQAIEFEYEIAPSGPKMQPTRIWQSFSIKHDSPVIEVKFRCDWQVVSNAHDPSPFLRARFDTGLSDSTATYQVPFGAVTRPNDGEEGPVQSWADLSGSNGSGLSIVVDCKHGFSSKDGILQMSMVRGNMSPDPLPNPGMQSADYEIVPHVKGWQTMDLAQKGAELQTSLLSIPVPPDAEGKAPLEYSFGHFDNPSAIATGLKLSEDNRGYVVRFFDSLGAGSMGSFHTYLAPKSASWVNFLEDRLAPAQIAGDSIKVPLRPWQIGTIEFRI